MTTRAYRFQADINKDTYLFTEAVIYDELMAEDPITRVVCGTGKFLGPFLITDKTHPDLFIALNAQAVKCDERVATARADYLKKSQPAPVVSK